MIIIKPTINNIEKSCLISSKPDLTTYLILEGTLESNEEISIEILNNAIWSSLIIDGIIQKFTNSNTTIILPENYSNMFRFKKKSTTNKVGIIRKDFIIPPTQDEKEKITDIYGVFTLDGNIESNSIYFYSLGTNGWEQIITDFPVQLNNSSTMISIDNNIGTIKIHKPVTINKVGVGIER